MPLPERQREELNRYLERCATVAPEFRWAAAGNLHLTVRFIGSAEQDVVEAVADRLEGSAGTVFELALGGVGTFKRGRLARVVYLDVSAGADPVRALAERVEAECVGAGLEPETRAFKPHLTLARARARDGALLPELPEAPDLEGWRAEELILYSSHLQKSGAVHEPIRAVRFTPVS